MTEDPHTRSDVLRAEFGGNWRWWSWFRQQWSAMSITVLVAGAAALGGWALNLKMRVVVLETEVVPVMRDEGRVDAIEAKVAAHEQRLTRLEDSYDTAYREAATPPPRKRPR